jgi:hypothetical protein
MPQHSATKLNPNKVKIKDTSVALDLFYSLFTKMPASAFKRCMASHSVDQFISTPKRTKGNHDKCHDTWGWPRFQKTIS